MNWNWESRRRREKGKRKGPEEKGGGESQLKQKHVNTRTSTVPSGRQDLNLNVSDAGPEFLTPIIIQPFQAVTALPTLPTQR